MVETSRKNNSSAQEPEEDTSSTLNYASIPPDTSSGESGDSLQIYLRQINKIPLLEQDKQKQLIHKIDLATVTYRRELYQLGFVMVEHLRIIDKIHDKTTNLSYDFLPSSLEDQTKAILQIPAWQKEIKDLYNQLHKAYHNKTDNQSTIRVQAVECLLRYEVVYDHLQEWHKVALGYISLSAPELKKPEQATLKDISPEKNFISRRKISDASRGILPAVEKNSGQIQAPERTA